MCLWGRCPHLRRVSRPASYLILCLGDTRPRELFRALNQPSLNRIVDNVSLDPPKLLPISHQMVITFILPKRLTRASQELIDLSRAITLQSAQQFRHIPIPVWSKKQVNMIGHDHPSMHLATSRAMLNAPAHQPRHLRPRHVNRSEPSRIQQSVQSHKRLSGSQILLGKRAPHRQTAIKPKRDENRSSRSVQVRQMAV